MGRAFDDGRDPGLVRWARWLADYLPQTLGAASTAAIGVCSILLGSSHSPPGWWHSPAAIALWGAIGANAVSAIRIAVRTPAIERLQRTNRTLADDLNQAQHEKDDVVDELRVLFRVYLQMIATDRLEFEDTERISVYRHEGRLFVPVGRYSKHPEFAEPGRGFYPDDEGCIGRAWHTGACVIEELPTDPTAYANVLKADWRIDKHVSRKLRMKSRSYVAFALEDRTQARFAVIVFESTRTGVLNYEQLQAIVAGPDGKMLVQIVERLAQYGASPTLAREEGF